MAVGYLETQFAADEAWLLENQHVTVADPSGDLTAEGACGRCHHSTQCSIDLETVAIAEARAAPRVSLDVTRMFRCHCIKEHAKRPDNVVSTPELRQLDGHLYLDRHCPAVLVIHHDPKLGSLVADRVDAAIRRHHRDADVVTEPGYYLEPAGSPPAVIGGGGGVTVSLANLNRVVVTTPPPVAALGHSVAVIDTGDADAGATVTDFTLGANPQRVSPVDIHGHGSAVAQLIRAYNSSAIIESLRVCTSGLAASVELFLALTFAMWPRGRFDVVNVSMTTQLVGKCETQLGKTIAAIADWCKTHGGLRTHGRLGPQLVTAVGNQRRNSDTRPQSKEPSS